MHMSCISETGEQSMQSMLEMNRKNAHTMTTKHMFILNIVSIFSTTGTVIFISIFCTHKFLSDLDLHFSGPAFPSSPSAAHFKL